MRYQAENNTEAVTEYTAGLHLLVDPENPSVECVESARDKIFPNTCESIIAVHGLDGHWNRSWTADNGVFWLKDLLPQLLPTARIFSFSHDSRTKWGDIPLTLDISDHGKDLVSELTIVRQLSHVSNLSPSLMNSNCILKTEKVPIILIGHSLGGLIIKSVRKEISLA